MNQAPGASGASTRLGAATIRWSGWAAGIAVSLGLWGVVLGMIYAAVRLLT
jgi:hypothetical protein